MGAIIGDPRKAGEEGPAGDQRKAGEDAPAGDPRPAGEDSVKANTSESKPKRDASKSK